mmetsp:Transcript_13594/g.15766  ORF Transcript_13594/g.15766 Transcript_13594/m.15766 type:complete len:251 (-) Transcript_13594:50-802(-)
MLEIPVCSLICSKASSMIFTFLMYLSRRCFFSLLFVLHLRSLAFSRSAGFENSSCSSTAVCPFLMVEVSLTVDFSSSPAVSSLTFKLSWSSWIFFSNVCFSASCLDLRTRILTLVSSVLFLALTLLSLIFLISSLILAISLLRESRTLMAVLASFLSMSIFFLDSAFLDTVLLYVTWPFSSWFSSCLSLILSFFWRAVVGLTFISSSSLAFFSLRACLYWSSRIMNLFRSCSYFLVKLSASRCSLWASVS